MIFKEIENEQKNIKWTIFHLILGFICTITPIFLIIWFYYILIDNLKIAIYNLKHKNVLFLLLLFSYLISFELLDRMAKTSPFIPYELGKYMLIMMGFIGLFYNGIRSKKGIIMALVLVPALFYDYSGQRIFKDIINYLIAPISVGLGISFSDKLKISESQLENLLKLIFWSSLSSLIYIFIKTPNLDEIEFDLGANFETTGGHASNQVSTILGLGLFLSFYSVFKNKNFSGSYITDVLILIGFAIQGLLSFSRGGMIVATLCIVIFIFLSNISIKRLLVSFSLVLILYVSFNYANSLTGGNLLLRYEGETRGTLLGTKEKTANVVTTGRLDIFQKDIDLWLNHPFTGVGLAASTYMRDETKLASHIELSRLLADHGLLGFIYSFLFFGMVFRYKGRFYNGNPILYILILFAVFTTFHSAMRTFLTPLFAILGSFQLSRNSLAKKTL